MNSTIQRETLFREKVKLIPYETIENNIMLKLQSFKKGFLFVFDNIDVKVLKNEEKLFVYFTDEIMKRFNKI